MAMLTRRQMMKLVAGTSMAAATGAAISETLAQTPRTVSIGSGWIGLSRAEWEAFAGQGTEHGELVEYPNLEVEGATIFVGFDADRVSHVEVGFEEAERGGVSPAEARAVVARAMPAGVELLEAFIVPAQHREGAGYLVERHTSTSVEGGPILVVYQEKGVTSGTGEPVDTVVARVTLALPGPHTLIAEVTGDPGGIGLPRDAWEAIHDEADLAQSGERYESVVVPGYMLLVQYAAGEGWVRLIDAWSGENTPQGLPYGDARPLALAAVPTDASLAQTYRLPGLPEGRIAMWAEVWESDTLAGLHGESGAVFVLFHLDGSEPTVPRISITAAVLPG